MLFSTLFNIYLVKKRAKKSFSKKCFILLLHMLYEIKKPLCYSRLIETRQNPHCSFHAHVNWHAKNRSPTSTVTKTWCANSTNLVSKSQKLFTFVYCFAKHSLCSALSICNVYFRTIPLYTGSQLRFVWPWTIPKLRVFILVEYNRYQCNEKSK